MNFRIAGRKQPVRENRMESVIDPPQTAGLQMDTAVLCGTASYLRVWRYNIRRTKNFQAAKADVLGSVSVCMFCMPAHLADKEVPGPSICPFGVQTPVALLAGLLRVHKDHGHPGSLCLMGARAPTQVKLVLVQPLVRAPRF